MTAPVTEIQGIIQAHVSDISETVGLVNDLGAPSLSETPVDLHRRLLVTRSAMTRVSEVLGEIVRVRGRLQGVLIDRKGELETATTEAVDRSNGRALALVQEEYSSAQLQNARLAAKTLDQRQRVRAAEKLLVDIDAALEYGRIKHRELDRAVRDVDTRMRILVFEPNFS